MTTSCVRCGGPVVAALVADAQDVEAGESPTPMFCTPCWRLIFGRELVATGRYTEYPGFKHDARIEQPGDAMYDLNCVLFRAWLRPDPWADGREFGE